MVVIMMDSDEEDERPLPIDSERDNSFEGCAQTRALDATLACENSSQNGEPDAVMNGHSSAVNLTVEPYSQLLMSAASLHAFQRSRQVMLVAQHEGDQTRLEFIRNSKLERVSTPPSTIAGQYALQNLIHVQTPQGGRQLERCLPYQHDNTIPGKNTQFLGTALLQTTAQQSNIALLYVCEHSEPIRFHEFIMIVLHVDLFDVEAHRFEAKHCLENEQLLNGWPSKKCLERILQSCKQIISTTSVESRAYHHSNKSERDLEAQMTVNGYLPWFRLRRALDFEIPKVLETLQAIAQQDETLLQHIESCAFSTDDNKQLYTTFVSEQVLRSLNSGVPVKFTTILRTDGPPSPPPQPSTNSNNNEDWNNNNDVLRAVVMTKQNSQMGIEFMSLTALVLYHVNHHDSIYNPELLERMRSAVNMSTEVASSLSSSCNPADISAHDVSVINRAQISDLFTEWSNLVDADPLMDDFACYEPFYADTKSLCIRKSLCEGLVVHPSLHQILSKQYYLHTGYIDDAQIKTILYDACIHVLQVAQGSVDMYRWYAPDAFETYEVINLAKFICLKQHCNTIVVYTEEAPNSQGVVCHLIEEVSPSFIRMAFQQTTDKS